MRLKSLSAVAALLAGVAGGRPVLAADPVRIVLVAGPKDHGAPGRHEYEKDMRSLKGCLDASNIPNLKTDVYVGKVPDVAELATASVIVMESSGDRTASETHALFPFDGATDHQGYPADMTDRLRAIDALAQKGMGVVVLHYATYVNNATARRYFTDWVGAFYESGYSRTVVTNWDIAPAGGAHPILNGVSPWNAREEFYIRLRMPEDARRTPLLMATPTAPTPLPALTAPMVPGGPPSPLTSPNVEPSLVSWAIERSGGGRGFVMTGVDWHTNLQMESYRREVLNGIIWAAKVAVPSTGVVCTLPAEN